MTLRAFRHGDTATHERWMIHGEPVLTHREIVCRGRACSLHRPSRHSMQDWLQYWRGEEGVIERLCPAHNIGHPDPDDVAHRRTLGTVSTVHPCCSCCQLQESDEDAPHKD